MGKILKAIHADDAAHYEKLGLIPHQVQLWEDGMRTDGSKGTYEYETPAGEFYRITYRRRNDISRQNFVDVMPGVLRFFAKLAGFEGSYLRFEGSATIERLENGNIVESVTEESAVWELMYFGKSGADKKFKGAAD